MQFQLALSVRQTGKSSSTATTVNTSKRAYRLASASERERRGPDSAANCTTNTAVYAIMHQSAKI